MVSNAPAAPSPRTRLAFALGSWQIVALEAALREADGAKARAGDDVLVLYETGTVSGALAAAMLAVGAAARPWRRIVEAFDIGLGWPKRLSERHARALQARLRERVGVDADAVDEIWLCRIDRRLERLVLETWPRAAVVLYEDGVLSYLPVESGPRAVHARFGRPVRRLARRLAALRGETGIALAERLGARRQGIERRHADRVVAARLLLGDVFPVPDWLRSVEWRPVAASTLRDTLASLRSLPAVVDAAPAEAVEPVDDTARSPARSAGPPGLDAPRPRVLVLGQALSRFHALPRDVERGIYAGVVAVLVGRGFDVLWKEHPRAVEPFFDALAAAAPGRVRALALPHALPVELIVDRLGLQAVVGGMTTALFYVPRVAPGVAAYSFADRFVPHLRRGWARQNALFVECLASLDTLPLA